MTQRKRNGRMVTNGYSLKPEHVEWLEKQAYREDISVSHYVRRLVMKDMKEKGGDVTC